MRRNRSRSIKNSAVGVLVSVAVLVGVIVAAAPAYARPTQSKSDKAISRINEAAGRVGAPHGRKSGPGVRIPTQVEAAATYQTPAGTLAMSIPATGDGEATSEGVVFDAPNANVVVQSTEEGGLRAVISIDSAFAPERYAFQIGGDVASLELDATGGAVALNPMGVPIAYAPAPWAADAAGASVPTHYEIKGDTLYQVIEHHAGRYQYGIAADPWWNPFSWPWGQWFSAAKSAVAGAFVNCGIGALRGAFGLGVTAGTTNVLIEKLSSTTARLRVGGVYGYVGAAVAGCLLANI